MKIVPMHLLLMLLSNIPHHSDAAVTDEGEEEGKLAHAIPSSRTLVAFSAWPSSLLIMDAGPPSSKPLSLSSTSPSPGALLPPLTVPNHSGTPPIFRCSVTRGEGEDPIAPSFVGIVIVVVADFLHCHWG